jgi:hypothetical protein
MSAQPNQLMSIRAQIITYFTNEMNNSGNNPKGRLQTIKAVGGGWVDAAAVWPYIGVVPIQEEVIRTVNQQKDLVIKWGINIIVRSSMSTEDAYNQLITLLSDGTGNGVNEVLDDFSHFTMNNLVYASYRERTDFYDDLAKNKASGTNQFAAFAVTQFITKSRLNIS